MVTEANRLAVAAIDSYPGWCHPVLLIVGPPGSGKSHLASAWQAVAGATRFPDASLRGAAPARPFAVVIDDIDRHQGAEADVFALVNAARLGGGFVLATARVKPQAMVFALPDLRSRLQAATLSEIGPPDDALLAGVLAKLFADRQIAVDARLISFVIRRMERSLEAAGRLVAAVDREALASKERISRHLVQRVLASAEFGGGMAMQDGRGDGGTGGLGDTMPRRDPEAGG